MIDTKLANLWGKNCKGIEEALDGCGSYPSILKSGLQYIGFDLHENGVESVDFGHYQGTMNLLFAENTYQPDASETYITYVYYGSCSYCDTLSALLEYDRPDEERKKGLTDLFLHMLQRARKVSAE